MTGDGKTLSAPCGHRILSLLLIALGISATGCGPLLKQMSVASTTEILRDGMVAFYREGDLLIAEQALASNLKVLEVLLESSPDNPDLLLLASQGFSTYTFAFVEDKIARDHRDPNRLEMDRGRARRLYLRGRDYGLRLLTLRHQALAASLNADLPALRANLALLRREDVPALFWTAYGWAGSIHWSLDQPEMLADLPRVLAMMDRVLELDEGYFFAGAHLFFGVYYASRSRALGGNPERARSHLDRALELAGPTILVGHVFLADPYAIQVQDRALFETQLRLILDAPEDLSPNYRLLNQVAKARARMLRERIDELFL
jgi:tetratricopeptide (TPR) repeat protein